MKLLPRWGLLLPLLLFSVPLLAQFTGIGTNAPQSKLHVNGTAWFKGDNTALSTSAGAGIAIGFPPGSHWWLYFCLELHHVYRPQSAI